MRLPLGEVHGLVCSVLQGVNLGLECFGAFWVELLTGSDRGWRWRRLGRSLRRPCSGHRGVHSRCCGGFCLRDALLDRRRVSLESVPPGRRAHRNPTKDERANALRFRIVPAINSGAELRILVVRALQHLFAEHTTHETWKNPASRAGHGP